MISIGAQNMAIYGQDPMLLLLASYCLLWRETQADYNKLFSSSSFPRHVAVLLRKLMKCSRIEFPERCFQPITVYHPSGHKRWLQREKRLRKGWNISSQMSISIHERQNPIDVLTTDRRACPAMLVIAALTDKFFIANKAANVEQSLLTGRCKSFQIHSSKRTVDYLRHQQSDR